MPNNPHLPHLQRIIGGLYIDLPESIAKQVKQAFTSYLTEQHRPADLWTHFRCVRCGDLYSWTSEHTEQHGRRFDDYRIIHHVCPNCSAHIKPR